METFGKIVKILLAGAGLGILGFLVRREFKKSVERQVLEDKARDEKLLEAGIDPERFDKEMVPGVDDENMVKALYISLDTEIDKDIIDIQNCIDNDNVIHLRQFDVEGRDKTIDILFEIPETSSERGNFNVPKITDYINAFMAKKNELEKELKQQIRTGLEGYFVVQFKDSRGHKIQGIRRIPKELHLPYSRGKNDGLVDYIDYLRSKDFKSVDLSKYFDTSDNYYEGVELLDIKLLFKLSVNRELTNLLTIRGILKDLIDFEVSRAGSQSKTVYEYIMFNAYGPAGNWSLLHYYNFRKGKGVVIEDYEY